MPTGAGWTPPVRIYSYNELLGASDGERLGTGGSADIFSGRLADGTRVAIKRLRGTAAGLAQTRSMSGAEQQFWMELHILGCFRHPHLLPVLGACVEPGQPLCLLYPLMEGRSLFARLHARKPGEAPLGPPQRLAVAAGACRGLAYLHARTHAPKPEGGAVGEASSEAKPSIIHRDIKSDNILLDGDGIARIADCGLARDLEAEATHATLALAGSEGYLDPEAVGSGHFGERSDVYAMGVVLLELLTGKPARARELSPPNLVARAWPALVQMDVGALCDEEANWPHMLALQLVALIGRCLRSRSPHGVVAPPRPSAAELAEELGFLASQDGLQLYAAGLTAVPAPQVSSEVIRVQAQRLAAIRAAGWVSPTPVSPMASRARSPLATGRSGQRATGGSQDLPRPVPSIVTSGRSAQLSSGVHRTSLDGYASVPHSAFSASVKLATGSSTSSPRMIDATAAGGSWHGARPLASPRPLGGSPPDASPLPPGSPLSPRPASAVGPPSASTRYPVHRASSSLIQQAAGPGPGQPQPQQGPGPTGEMAAGSSGRGLRPRTPLPDGSTPGSMGAGAFALAEAAALLEHDVWVQSTVSELLRALLSPAAPGREEALRQLAVMARDSPLARKHMKLSDGVGLLARLIAAPGPSAPERVREAAMIVLRGLATSAESCAFFVLKGGLAGPLAVLTAATGSTETAREEACATLLAVADGAPAVLARASEPATLRELEAAVGAHTETDAGMCSATASRALAALRRAIDGTYAHVFDLHAST